MGTRTRKRTMRRIQSTPHPVTSDTYFRLLGAPHSNKVSRRMLGGLINQELKSGDVEVWRIESKRKGPEKGPPIIHTGIVGRGSERIREYDAGIDANAARAAKKIFMDPFSEGEKKIAKELFNHNIFRPFSKRPLLKHKRSGGRVSRLDLDPRIGDSPNPYGFFQAAQEIGRICIDLKREGRSPHSFDQLRRSFLCVSATLTILRDVHPYGRRDSSQSIYEAVSREIGPDADSEWFISNIDGIRVRIENHLQKARKGNRKQLENQRLERARTLRGELVQKGDNLVRAGGPLTRFLRLLSPFEIPRAKRKAMVKEFEEDFLSRRAETRGPGAVRRKTNKFPQFVRQRMVKAFKSSRVIIREKLAQAGMNPDQVLNDLDLLNGEGHHGDITTNMMRRLNTLSAVLRNKNTSAELGEAVNDMRAQHAQRRGNRSPAHTIPVVPALPSPAVLSPNLRKQAKRDRRKGERERRMAAAMNNPRPEANARPTPRSVGEWVNFMDTAHQINSSQRRMLYDLVAHIPRTPSNHALIIRAVRHLILLERATFGIKGRMSETALMHRSLPRGFEGEFNEALQLLMKEKIFFYDHHLGRHDFIQFVPFHALSFVKKYGYKKNPE